MSAAGSHHVSRRALIGGYRVSDVEVTLASLNLALSQLRLELEATRRRLVVAEGRAADGEGRMERARQVEMEAAETVRRLQQQHEEQARLALDRAAAAEAEAARQREAAEHERRLRLQVTQAIQQLGRELDGGVHEPAASASAAVPDVFGTNVELDAGPFGDLASLTEFEQSLHALPGVREVYIRGFAAGRATIDLTLRAPSPVLQEMTERLPYRFDVASTDAGHISVTVERAALRS